METQEYNFLAFLFVFPALNVGKSYSLRIPFEKDLKKER